jgi:hypothetical protein
MSLAVAHEVLATLENSTGDLPARNNLPVATSWTQDVLAMEVQAPTWATMKPAGPRTLSSRWLAILHARMAACSSPMDFLPPTAQVPMEFASNRLSK